LNTHVCSLVCQKFILLLLLHCAAEANLVAADQSKIRFIAAIQRIFESSSPALNPPLFIFNLSQEAAEYNAAILSTHDFDLDKIIKNQHPSQISYGSEFRQVSQLQDLLSDHPLWPRLREILEHGATFPLEEISEVDRTTDLNFHSKRGNHKSALDYHEMVLEIIKEDVERGFALPLPISSLQSIRHASLAPLGCVRQASLDSSGNRTFKHRMIHDQSFPGPSTMSVNL
jgi:hypothetical protein